MNRKRHLCRNYDKVVPVDLELSENDIVNSSIQRIVDEILEDIGDIFIRENLFEHECEMILTTLEEKIKKVSQRSRQ